MPFAKYWLHGGMLQINSEKMSKSLGNFTLLKDVLGRYNATVIRLLMLQTHYRSSLDFSDSRLDETIHAYNRLANLLRNLRWARDLAVCGLGVPAEALDGLRAAIEATREKFEFEMDDDFNTAGALAAVFELAKAGNTFLADYQATCARTTGSCCSRPRTWSCPCCACSASRYRADQTCCYPLEVVDSGT